MLSGPMGGTTATGVLTQPMLIAWRGVFCNTGGVVFADEREWSMPPLRIGHKGLHVERLDGLPYIFNRQYWPERLNCGRTSASEIASRTSGSATQPTSWTPHPRDQSADMLILMRNRAMIASHGRFLQPDPNATGLPVMGDLSFGGSALSPPRPEVELSSWTTDGLNVLAYCGGDAVNRGDPTGKFAITIGTMGSMVARFGQASVLLGVPRTVLGLLTAGGVGASAGLFAMSADGQLQFDSLALFETSAGQMPPEWGGGGPQWQPPEWDPRFFKEGAAAVKALAKRFTRPEKVILKAIHKLKERKSVSGAKQHNPDLTLDVRNGNAYIKGTREYIGSLDDVIKEMGK